MGHVEISCDENGLCKYSEHKVNDTELTLEGFFNFDDEISWGILGNCALGSPLINDGKGIALDDGTSTKKYFAVAIEQHKVEDDEVLAIEFYNGNDNVWYTIVEGSTRIAYRNDASPKTRTFSALVHDMKFTKKSNKSRNLIRPRGVCEDMCKEVGAYPKCTQCPSFVEPDSTPGVMTWDELLDHMDNISEWGHESLKGWCSTAGG